MTTNAEKVRLIFGLKVKQLRQDKGIPAYELADRAGVSPSYLNEIEKGKKYPKQEKIFALAAALGTDYDTLVSMKLSKKLEPIAELLNSNILQEMPLDLFGLDAADLLELLSAAPSRVSAFISTIIEISRTHGMNVEQFYFSALRSYQELHDNYFEEIETVADHFLSENTLSKEMALAAGQLTDLLSHRFGYRIEPFEERERPALAGLRSLWLPDSRTLLVNSRMEPEQVIFTLARELGYEVMQIRNRPLISSVIEAESFEQVLNNFRASYFAGAILIPKMELVQQLNRFFARTEWSDHALPDILGLFPVTPEVLLHRISNVLPGHFGINELFFLRFDHRTGEKRFVLSKEMHLAKLHNPHATVNEHNCRRWVSLTALMELDEMQQAGIWNGQPLGRGQVSEYLDSQSRYLMLTLAKPSPPKAGVNSSVSLGLAIDDKLRALVRFLNDDKLIHRIVNETCERCSLADCHERVYAPVVWQRHRRHEELKRAVKELSAGNVTASAS
ncbi:helix-turn-helix domain-containing protein [Tellurirhabdus rosea]|uniref:helix-turn-helix domain-containing protein n=1 Tax=Tellurirhabdus rosea TaxID=2674997 RepID=UPI00224E06F8|nr:helix-turn-helix transcriptional regulator [Tellurirhabdus rosea]